MPLTVKVPALSVVVDNAIESAKQQEQLLARQKAEKRKQSRDAR
jgi:hypothetical protein